MKRAALLLFFVGFLWHGAHGRGFEHRGWPVLRQGYESYGGGWSTPGPKTICSRPLDPKDPAAWTAPWFTLPELPGYHCIRISG